MERRQVMRRCGGACTCPDRCSHCHYITQTFSKSINLIWQSSSPPLIVCLCRTRRSFSSCQTCRTPFRRAAADTSDPKKWIWLPCRWGRFLGSHHAKRHRAALKGPCPVFDLKQSNQPFESSCRLPITVLIYSGADFLPPQLLHGKWSP